MFRTSTATSEDAIRLTLKEIEKWKDSGHKDLGGDYSNINGDFFFEEGLTIIAAIPGLDVLRIPTVHLVTRMDLTWYKQAAEILVEFCQHGQTLADKKVVWSG